MHEPPSHIAQQSAAQLANIVGLDHLGQVWIRTADSLQREVAWVVSSIDGAMLELAMTQQDFVLVHRVAPANLPIVAAIVRSRVENTRLTHLAEEGAERVVHASELSLGEGKAKLSVRGNTLHIEAESIVSYARARNRIVGGSVELG